MAAVEEAKYFFNSYPDFDWSPGNPITDGYKNEDDDKSEYKHSHGVKEEISLEDEVDIHKPLEDEYVIKEMSQDKYHEEDPNII